MTHNYIVNFGSGIDFGFGISSRVFGPLKIDVMEPFPQISVYKIEPSFYDYWLN